MAHDVKSRTSKSIKNIISGVFSQVFLAFISLFTARVIKYDLGFEYLGLNGTLSNVVGLLSLAELGIGSAIGFALYKPLAHDDKEKVIALMQFYRKAYRIIALVITGVSVALLPLLPFIVKTSLSLSYVYLVYGLFVLNTVLSYLLSYKQCLLTSDQKNYIRTFYSTIATFAVKILQLLAIVLFDSYIVYLVSSIVVTLALNIALALKVDSLYPYINDKSKKNVDEETKNMLKSKIKAMFFHSIGNKCVNGTDSIIVSSFLGVVQVGIYTSYYSIILILNGIITTAFGNLSASVGNFVVEKSSDELYLLFKKLLVIENTIALFVCACFFTLITPFVECWLGQDALLSMNTVSLFTFNMFLQIKRCSIGTVTAASGLFEFNQYAPIIESIVNLVVSIVCVQFLGINGVILGTIVSCLCVPFWIAPVYVYKNVFKKNFLLFFLDTFITLFVTCLLICGISFVQSKVSVPEGWGGVIIRFCISIFISLVIIACIFGKRLFSILKRR